MPKGREGGSQRSPLRWWRRQEARLLGLTGSPHDVRHAIRAREEQVLRWVGISALVGVLTGASVAVFDYVLRDQIIFYLYTASNALLYALLPAVGLALSRWLLIWLVKGGDGQLTEAYISAYHDPARRLGLRDVPGKLLASLVTIGSGGGLGLEGPSVFLGASLGDSIQKHYGRLFSREDAKLLLVAGAAAGMAAIFKAPLTGVIFSFECPYKDGLRSKALVPALVASGSSYVTFVLLVGSEPIFAHAGALEFGLVEVLLAGVLGLLCGAGAWLFVALVRGIRRLLGFLPEWVRPLAAGFAVGGIGALVFWAFGEPLIYGPGYRALRHVLAGADPPALLALLLLAKALSTSLTMAGGGVGGVFFPQAVLGATLGALFGKLAGGADAAIYPLMGAAAFLGAGYRTPLAAVAFVAETTGNPWALIPAMLAAVASVLVMGQRGISDAQR